MSSPRPPSRRPRRAGLLVAALLGLACAAGLQGQAAPPDAGRDTAEAGQARAALPAPDPIPDPELETALGWALFSLQATYFDQGVRSAALRARSPTMDDLAGAAEWLGDWQATFPYLLAGTAAIGGLTGGERGLLRGASFLGGVVAGAMTNEVVNRTVGRQRPWIGGDPYDFEPFRGHTSFPSGHASYAFSIAGGLDALTDGWVPVVAYGAAGATALSRVYHDKHWFVDVVVGSVIGAHGSRYATRQLLLLTGTADPPRGAERARDGRARGAEGLRFVATPGFVGFRLRF